MLIYGHLYDEWGIFHWGDVDKMQSTGLTDKTGKEIFEGDILLVKDPNGEIQPLTPVKWDGGCYPIEGVMESYDYSPLNVAIDVGFVVEVVGTLHENPELLK